MPVKDKVGEALPRELLHVAVEALPIAAPLANLGGQFNSFVEISTDFSTEFSTEFL